MGKRSTLCGQIMPLGLRWLSLSQDLALRQSERQNTGSNTESIQNHEEDSALQILVEKYCPDFIKFVLIFSVVFDLEHRNKPNELRVEFDQTFKFLCIDMAAFKIYLRISMDRKIMGDLTHC